MAAAVGQPPCSSSIQTDKTKRIIPNEMICRIPPLLISVHRSQIKMRAKKVIVRKPEKRGRGALRSELLSLRGKLLYRARKLARGVSDMEEPRFAEG